MDHQEAIRLRAVERYLLGELEPPQRSEFEEHFFVCTECATDLRVTDEFLDAARKELRSVAIGGTIPRTLKRFWIELFLRPAVLAPAFALLLGVIIYQNMVVLPRFNGEIAQIKRPEVVAAISLIGGNSRGVASVAPTGSAGQPFVLSLDIPATQQYSSYACVLFDSAGKVVLRVPVSAAQAQDTVSISVPAGNLHAGHYLLAVQGVKSGGVGAQATDLARYRFTLTPAVDH
jgi:anti-sigma factor RsiW